MKQKYRKGVGIFLLNKKNQLWVGKRFDYKNEYWQMPQGGIDELESPEKAMKRELMEETGLNKNYKIISKTNSWLEYKLPQNLVNEVWGGKYVGQKQIWFACRFLGNDNQIDIEKFNKPEFCEWRWINPKDCLDLVVPFKKILYRKILKNFNSFY